MRVAQLASVALLVGLIGAPAAEARSPDPSPSPSAATASPTAMASQEVVSIPGLILAPGARIGADPPLGDPVQPTGRVVAPDLDRTPDLDEALGPVRLQIWLPEGTAGPGDTLRIHVRITNRGKRTIRLFCPGFNLGSWTASLFPDVPARTRDDEFYRLMLGVLDPGLLTVRFTPRPDDNPACEGKAVAARFPLGASHALDVTSDALLVAPYGHQALPGGTLHISSGVQWTPVGGGPEDGGALGLSGDIPIDGPSWPWANPLQLVDAIDAIPAVRALFDRPVGWEVVDVDVATVLERLAGWVLPAGVDPSELLAWRLDPAPADPDDGATP